MCVSLSLSLSHSFTHTYIDRFFQDSSTNSRQQQQQRAENKTITGTENKQRPLACELRLTHATNKLDAGLKFYKLASARVECMLLLLLLIETNYHFARASTQSGHQSVCAFKLSRSFCPSSLVVVARSEQSDASSSSLFMQSRVREFCAN